MVVVVVAVCFRGRSLFVVVVVGGRRGSPCVWSLLVVVCVDGGGKQKRNIVCYSSQIDNKQINDSTGIPFLPIPGNIPV